MDQLKRWIKKYQNPILTLLAVLLQWILGNWSNKVMEMFTKILPYLPLYLLIFYFIYKEEKAEKKLNERINNEIKNEMKTQLLGKINSLSSVVDTINAGLHHKESLGTDNYESFLKKNLDDFKNYKI